MRGSGSAPIALASIASWYEAASTMPRWRARRAKRRPRSRSSSLDQRRVARSDGYTAAMDRPVQRRRLLGAVASSAAALVTACSTDVSNRDTQVVADPTLGKVYQWEKDDLLVLLSGVQPSY